MRFLSLASIDAFVLGPLFAICNNDARQTLRPSSLEPRYKDTYLNTYWRKLSLLSANGLQPANALTKSGQLCTMTIRHWFVSESQEKLSCFRIPFWFVPESEKESYEKLGEAQNLVKHW